MVCAPILLCLLLGTVLACVAETFPSHVIALERCGGALLVLSLASLGGLLHYFGEVHHPTQIESLIGTTAYFDVAVPDRIVTAAAPGAAQTAADW
jgi:hypothetical protein